MNYLKDSVTGIDRPIQALQTFLYSQVKALWNLSDTSFNMFGRAYRNQTEDGYVPEFFTGGLDYNDLFFDDKVSATAFFGVAEKQTYASGSATADVFLIFMVNLDKIKTTGKRLDEEARNDIEILCSQQRNSFTMVGFDTGLDSVFKEYTGWKKKDGIKYRDQHPYHCFRINFKLLYNIKKSI